MLESISGKTTLLGLIGSPVGHSGSPKMYNYGFEQLGIDSVYLAFDVKEAQVSEAIQAFRTFKMSGNVTMPCKTAVASYMDELTPAATMVGAVNTIVHTDGKLVGHITDGIGFTENLRAHDVEVEGKTFVILGVGGAATAIQVQLAIEGAQSIMIFNRQDHFYQKGQETVARIKTYYPDLTIEIHDIDDHDYLAQAIEKADCLVNATVVGMGEDNTNTPITDRSMLRSDLTVADVIYNPPVTQLLKDAQSKGCKTIGGEGMLLGQGKAAFKLFTGRELPVKPFA